MTFDAKIKLRAGFPCRYLLVFTLLIISVPLYLAFKSYQSELDWIWSGLMLMVSLVAGLVLFREQQKQQKYSLLIDAAAPLELCKRQAGTDTVYKITRSDFTRQTRNIVFARLCLDKGNTIHLVFHAAGNRADAFRRFLVMLKMPRSSDF